MKNFHLGAVMYLALGTGCALETPTAADEPVEPGESAVMNGQTMTPTSLNGEAYVPGSVMIDIVDGGWCSGFLINSHAMISSAHCFRRNGRFGGDFRIQVRMVAPDGAIRCIQNRLQSLNDSCTPIASHVHVHPNFDGDGDNGDDIALIWIGYGWGAPADTSRSWLRLMKTAPQAGDKYRKYGWGASNDGVGYRVPRYAHVLSEIGWVFSTYFLTGFRTADYPRNCGGDSGAPMVRPRGTLEPIVIGVHEGSPGSVGDCPEADDANEAVRIDKKIGWIDSIIPFTCDTWTTTAYQYVTCWD